MNLWEYNLKANSVRVCEMLESNSPSFDKPTAVIQMTSIKYIDGTRLNEQRQLLVML